jgi:hypothetical protein
MGDTARELGREAADSTSLDSAVRFGLVAYGVVHVMIACYGLFCFARARHLSR